MDVPWGHAEGPPWARKWQGITVPWDHSLDEVDESMSRVGIIIFKSLQVSSYFAARRGSLARALAENCANAEKTCLTANC